MHSDTSWIGTARQLGRFPVGMTWTYIIAANPYDGWAKIGRTDYDPLRRLATLQTGNPRRLEVVAMWPVDAEDTLHRLLADLRGVGEWFALAPDMLEAARPTSGHPRGFIQWIASPAHASTAATISPLGPQRNTQGLQHGRAPQRAVRQDVAS